MKDHVDLRRNWFTSYS